MEKILNVENHVSDRLKCYLHHPTFLAFSFFHFFFYLVIAVSVCLLAKVVSCSARPSLSMSMRRQTTRTSYLRLLYIYI